MLNQNTHMEEVIKGKGLHITVVDRGEDDEPIKLKIISGTDRVFDRMTQVQVENYGDSAHIDLYPKELDELITALQKIKEHNSKIK